jgi:hypothetical protein
VKDTPEVPEVTYARERAIRDSYADDLQRYRPEELEVNREALPGLQNRKRADLVTVDRQRLLRVWEFKIRATAEALGQLLVYLALCRRHYGDQRVIRAVLAAAEFDPDVTCAIEALNLGVEVVVLPPAVLNAGKVPFSRPDMTVPALTI